MTRAVLVLLALTSAACSGTKRVGGQPSWRAGAKASGDKPTGPITFVPKTEAATRYNERIQAPPKSPLSDAVILAVKDAATKGSMQVPVADARLFRACAEIAELTPEKSIVDNNVIEFVIQRHGIIEPTPHMLVVWGDINDAEVIVEQLRPRIVEILADGATARVGIGTAKRRADGTGAIVFALQASAVNTNPIPRSLARGGSFALDAVIESRYREPELFVTHDDGKTELLPIVIGKSGGFKATFQCGKHIGRQQVEITASDQAGPTVLANFPVWCGEEPPATITIDQSQEDNEDIAADEAERRVLALVNRDRLAAGFSALLWDDKVAAVSRGHSEDMKKTKIVAHVSPTTGSAADRVRAAGLKTALVLENVARAYSVAEAHAALMNSPGHRANVLAPLATHVGIGIVLGDKVGGKREMFLTQVFTRVPPKVDPAQAAALVHERINKVRRVGVHAGLAGVARELAQGLAAGKTRESLWPAAKKKIDTMNGAYARVGSVVSAAADLDSIDGAELVGDYKVDDIGVGIAQGNHPQIGEGAIWIVVLLAEKLPGKK